MSIHGGIYVYYMVLNKQGMSFGPGSVQLRSSDDRGSGICIAYKDVKISVKYMWYISYRTNRY